MNQYSSKIYQSSWYVVAKIYRNEQVVCEEWFYGMFDTNRAIEKRFKKAHKWAAERIKILQDNESSTIR